MDLKQAIFAATLTGIMAFAAVGCGGNTETTSVVHQPSSTTKSAPTATQTPPALDNTRPAPPSDNGTISAPPQGGIQGEKPAMPQIDYAAAAAKLDITEEQLKAALGELEQGPLDLAAAARQLGVTEDALREALGLPAGGQPQGGPPPDNATPPLPGDQIN